MSLKDSAKSNWWRILITVIALLYISNLGAGLVELIPDIMPLVGNLDESAIAAIATATWTKWR